MNKPGGHMCYASGGVMQITRKILLSDIPASSYHCE